jgi:hypothetical protein
MAQTSGIPRDRRTRPAAWLPVIGLILATATARADTVARSELLTPTGWEANGPAAHSGDSDDGLLVPAGWDDAHGGGTTRAGAPQWSVPLCSELVVPADWAQWAGAH